MVVMDALVNAGQDPELIFFLDENAARTGGTILGHSIVRLDGDVDLSAHRFHVCVGDNRDRQRIHERLAASGSTPHTVVHPASIVAASATLASGVFVAARAIVAPAAHVGTGAIVNHAAIIDHESDVGGFCHVAPGATLAGNVRLGMRAFIGAGANILPGIQIGEDAVVGAGAVVTVDVPSQSTCVGVPAHRIR
jgi:sugar O-acyltransferase (sialic acid O-acetyltransferase NeuD family)